jgi:simple sugar transport system substrate-binding protein
VVQCVLSKRYGFAGMSTNTGAGVVTSKTIGQLLPLIQKGIR